MVDVGLRDVVGGDGVAADVDVVSPGVALLDVGGHLGRGEDLVGRGEPELLGAAQDDGRAVAQPHTVSASFMAQNSCDSEPPMDGRVTVRDLRAAEVDSGASGKWTSMRNSTV